MTGVLKPCEEEKYRISVLTTPVRLSNITEFARFPRTEIKDLCEEVPARTPGALGTILGRHYYSIPYLISPAPVYTAQIKHYCTLECQYSPFPRHESASLPITRHSSETCPLIIPLGEISLRDYFPLTIPISCQSQEPLHSTTYLQGMRLIILQNSGPAHDSNGQREERPANPLHQPQGPPHNRLTIDHLRPDVNALLQSRPYIYRPTFHFS
jgi:hypothetical protein